MVSSAVFAEPSVNHSQIQDQHWSAPLTCLTNQHLDPFPYPKTSEKTGDYRSNFHEHMHVMRKLNPAVPCSYRRNCLQHTKIPQSPSASVLKPEQLFSCIVSVGNMSAAVPTHFCLCHPWCDSVIMQTAWSSITECFWFEILLLEFSLQYFSWSCCSCCAQCLLLSSPFSLLLSCL